MVQSFLRNIGRNVALCRECIAHEYAPTDSKTFDIKYGLK